jgi:hypothetical protein
MTGFTRTFAKVTDDVILAEDFNDEFQALEDAFSNTTGHVHDGSVANGAYVPLISDADNSNAIQIDSTNNEIEFYTEVATVKTAQMVLQDGKLLPAVDNDIDLGSASFEFKDLYIDGTANIDSLVADSADINGGTIDNVVIGGTTPAAGTFTTFTSTGGITQENSGAQVLTINSTDNSGAAIKLSNTGSSNMGILVDSGVFSITDNLFTTSHLSISDSTSAATFAGALTCGTFTSAGIDDNATTETFQLGNAQADWGQSGNTFTHLRNVTDSWMAFSGSTAVNTGANVLCYGDAHSTSPNVLRLRQGSTDAIRIDTNIEISKNLELDGADIFQALATDAFIVSGGTTNILGGAILLYGQNHDSQAGDVALRSSNNEFFRWDESAGTLTLSTGIGSKTTAITIESTQVVSLKNDTALVWGTGTSRPAIIGDTVADTLDFYTSGSSALTLDSSQNATFSGVLNVSAAIPEVKLTDVGGNCYHNITGTANGSLTIAADVGDSGLNGSSLIFKVDNGEVMSIDSAGLTTFAANVTATQLILDSTNPYIKLADSDAPDNNYYVRDQSGVFKVQRFNGSDVLQSTPLQIDSTDVATFASNILFSGANWQLKSSTSDAADTSSGALGGGGGIGTSRGGYVQCFGNENATAAGDVRIYGGAVAGGGDIDIQAGSVAGQITLATGGNTALTIDSSQNWVHGANNIWTDSTNSYLLLSGGNALSTGGELMLFGSTHSTSPNAIKLRNAGATALEIDASGNVGIGVTPEAWQTGRAAIQLGPTASLHCSGTTSTASTVLGNNYYRSATGATYQVTNHSAIYYQLNGEHVWNIAPSGTAGTSITFSEAMKIENDGDLYPHFHIKMDAGKGIYMNGGTTAANLLDDYEEGTWTPTYVASTTDFTSITYNTQTGGRYTKIGNLVFIQGTLYTDALSGGTGNIYIGNLPFTAAPASSGYNDRGSITINQVENFNVNHPNIAQVVGGSIYAVLKYRNTSNGSDNNLSSSDMNTGAASNLIRFNGFYSTNQ